MEQNDSARQTAIEDAIRRMEWEGAPISVGDPFVRNSRFPERVGRIRIPTTSDIAEVQIQQVKP